NRIVDNRVVDNRRIDGSASERLTTRLRGHCDDATTRRTRKAGAVVRSGLGRSDDHRSRKSGTCRFRSRWYFYFLPFRRSRIVEEALNFNALRAGIFTGSPVCGLRPVDAFFLMPSKEPKPGHDSLSPFFAAATVTSKKAPRSSSASFFDTPAVSAT